jgi:thiamine biosynthesis protein ThiS
VSAVFAPLFVVGFLLARHNGESVAAPARTTISALPNLLDLDPAQIAVELDGKVVRREAWSDLPIGSGATLEIVRFVGGG